MTRVNIIDPKYLTDQHLIAEKLELNYVIGSAIRSNNSKNGLRVNDKFTLGKGHVSFFHNKLQYIQNRFKLIIEEGKHRGFEFNESKFHMRMREVWILYPHLMNDYSSSIDDEIIIKNRIKQKIEMKPQWYRYFGGEVPLEIFNYYGVKL